MTQLTIYVSDRTEAALRRASIGEGRTPEDLAASAVENYMDASRYAAAPQYQCPVCSSLDPNAYLRCNRPDCTDGRDPR